MEWILILILVAVLFPQAAKVLVAMIAVMLVFFGLIMATANAGTTVSKPQWHRVEVVDESRLSIESMVLPGLQFTKLEQRWTGTRYVKTQGISKLWRQRNDAGEVIGWRCVIAIKRGASAHVLAHERRHCMGWAH